MSTARAIAALLTAGALSELTRAKSFAETAPKPVTSAHAPALKLAAAKMPCGVPRLDPDAHGIPVNADGVGVDLLREYKIQALSLSAAFGSVLGHPKLPGQCAAEWSEHWLDVWNRAASVDHARYSLRVKFDPFNEGTDWRTLQPLSPSEKAKGARLSNLGVKLERLRLVRSLTIFSLRDALYSRFDDVDKAIASFALTMDTEGTTGGDPDLSLGTLAGDVAQNAKNLATGGAQGIGDLFAAGIEKIIAPIIGTSLAATLGVIGSAAGPYLLIGGVAYYVFRKHGA